MSEKVKSILWQLVKGNSQNSFKEDDIGQAHSQIMDLLEKELWTEYRNGGWGDLVWGFIKKVLSSLKYSSPPKGRRRGDEL